MLTDITDGICTGPGSTGTAWPLGSIITGYGPVGDLQIEQIDTDYGFHSP